MILMYHNIGPEVGFNTVSTSAFRDQLRYLADHFRVVSIGEYIDGLLDGKPDPSAVVLSFDDAYRGFPRYAMPFLARVALPVVLYVPTASIGGSNVWDRQVPDRRPLELMGYDVLRDLAGVPEITIGSHGVSHQSLRLMNASEVVYEMAGSRCTLEERLGVSVHHFSFPFGRLGDIPENHAELCQRAGYESACSTRYGRHNTVRSLFALKRIEIEPADDFVDFTVKLCHVDAMRRMKRMAREILYRVGMGYG